MKIEKKKREKYQKTNFISLLSFSFLEKSAKGVFILGNIVIFFFTISSTFSFNLRKWFSEESWLLYILNTFYFLKWLMTDFLSLLKNLAYFDVDLSAIINLSPYLFYKLFMQGFLSSRDWTFLNRKILLYFELFFVKMTDWSWLFWLPYCLLLFHPFPKVILKRSSLSKF